VNQDLSGLSDYSLALFRVRLADLTVRDQGMGALASRVLASIDILLFFNLETAVACRVIG
jgi:hypothetical protein